jgi:RNA polymerase sigma-70 factor (ECF subfamily)
LKRIHIFTYDDFLAGITKTMQKESTAETEKFLSEISLTVRTVLARKFPTLPWNEKEDIEQEVRLKLWKILTSGKKLDRPGSYLWKVVYTTALDLLNGKGKELPLDAASGMKREPRAEVDWPGADQMLDLDRRLEALSRNRRIVLKLGLTGLDLGEIAVHLGWSRARVRHLHYRGLNDLKKMIQREREDDDGRR